MIIYITAEFFEDYCESDPLAVIESALGALNKDAFLTRLFTPFAMYHGEDLEGFEFESGEISDMIEEFLNHIRKSAVFMTAEKYYELSVGDCDGQLITDRKFLVRVFGHTYEIDHEVDGVFVLSEYIGRIYGGTKVLTHEFSEAKRLTNV